MSPITVTLTATLVASLSWTPDPAHDATHEPGVAYLHTVTIDGQTCERLRDEPDEPDEEPIAWTP